jgi:hypothetical protein
VERAYRRFPLEPIRFIGGQVVRAAVIAKERAESADRRPSWFARSLAAFAPSGLEDKE